MSGAAPGRAVVLLPTYNERDNIERVTAEILASAEVDIWVLDDASPDGTGPLADALAAQEPRIRVSHRPAKLGLGRAYLDGFRLALDAGYERILEMDADLSHPPGRLPEMLRLSETYDLVLGSRWIAGGGATGWPWHRRMISRGGSFYARTLLGVPVRDLTGGFKCFRRQVLEQMDLDGIRSTGYAFQIEMTYRALQRGFSVMEMPITFADRQRGRSKMSRGIVLEAVLRVPQLRLEARR